MIKDFIYDLRAIKYKCIQAYFHFQLEDAQRLTDEGKGEVCVRNVDYISNAVLEIKETIEKNHNTYEEMVKLSKSNPFIPQYYNVIGVIVKKHFAVNEGWIPSLLTIEVLRLFKEKGYKDFEHIDFQKLSDEYEKFHDKKKGSIPLHFKCAEEIVKSIDRKKLFSKKRKKK